MLTALVYTNRMTCYAASEHYSSLPLEQRQKAFTQLAKKSMEKGKKSPVYLLVELAKTTPSDVPFTAEA